MKPSNEQLNRNEETAELSLRQGGTRWDEPKSMNGLSMVIVGLGLGLLAGFSISPVISGIITTLVGIAATVVAILGRFNESSDSREVFEETPPESSDVSTPIPEETEAKVEGKKVSR